MSALRTAPEIAAAFDRGFAAPRETTVEATEGLLLVRVAGEPYAIRLSEVQSLHVDRPIAPVPTAATALLGLVGLRGALAPAYDLRVLLGHPGGAPGRWLLVARGATPLALVFDELEAHVQVATARVSLTPPTASHLGGVVRVADVARPLVHIASLCEALSKEL